MVGKSEGFAPTDQPHRLRWSSWSFHLWHSVCTSAVTHPSHQHRKLWKGALVMKRLHDNHVFCVLLSLQLLDGHSGERHFPTQSPPLLGPKPAGQESHQRQPQPQPAKAQNPTREGLPLQFDWQLPVASVQPVLPGYSWPADRTRDERDPGAEDHGLRRAEDGPAAGDGSPDAAGRAQQWELRGTASVSWQQEHELRGEKFFQLPNTICHQHLAPDKKKKTQTILQAAGHKYNTNTAKCVRTVH